MDKFVLTSAPEQLKVVVTLTGDSITHAVSSLRSRDSNRYAIVYVSSRDIGYQLQSATSTKCDTTYEYNSGFPVEDPAGPRRCKSFAAGYQSHRQCRLELQL